LLKAIEFFSSKAAPAVELWRATIDLVKSAVDVKTPSPADIEAIYSSLTTFINRTVQMSKEVNTEGLLLAAKIAESIIPLASGLKSWVEFSAVARDYTAIAATVWDAIVADFQKGLQLLHLLIADALVFVDEAKMFDDLMTTGTNHLASGFAKFAAALNNSASVLSGTLSNLNAMTTFSNSLSSSAFSTAGGGASSSPVISQSFFNSPVASGGFAPQGQTIVNINVTVPVQGSLIQETNVTNRIMTALVELVQTGRLPIKSGGSIQFSTI
jgi:hypothetical protein